jgi:hypothetical protein
VVQKSQYVTGQFGFNYQFKNFNIGFALPNVFDSKPNSLKEFQEVKFNPFSNKFGSISYNFNFRDIQLSPTVLYRALDTRQDQWEGMLIASYRSFLWVGASYRDGYGITGLIGIKLKGLLKVGYAYEHPTSDIASASSGSHEIYLGMQFGKRDREEEFVLNKKKTDSLSQVAQIKKVLEEQKNEPIIVDEKKPVVTEEPKVIIKEPIIEEPVIVADNEKLIEEQKPAEETKEEVIPADYYVVLGAYHNEENALTQMRKLREKSLMPEMLYVLEKNYYYVYLIKTNYKSEALKELVKERERNRYAGVWLYKVPKKKQ